MNECLKNIHSFVNFLYSNLCTPSSSPYENCGVTAVSFLFTSTNRIFTAARRAASLPLFSGSRRFRALSSLTRILSLPLTLFCFGFFSFFSEQMPSITFSVGCLFRVQDARLDGLFLPCAVFLCVLHLQILPIMFHPFRNDAFQEFLALKADSAEAPLYYPP